MMISKKCKKVQNWILFHSGEEEPVFVKKHLITCSPCIKFAEEEQWIHSQIEANDLHLESIPLEQTLKVKQAIWETSQHLAHKKQRVNYLFPKVAGVFTILTILLTFFFAPMFQGETYFGYQVNQTLKSFILNTETVNVSFMGDSNGSENLKFASQYVETQEEKKFYYTTNSLSKENYLFLKVLSNKTKVDVSKIYGWYIQGGYAFCLRKLNLPYQKTVKEIEKYLSQFRQSKSIPTFSLDGLVLWVDYLNDTIRIDTYNQEIKLDVLAMQTVFVGYYANFYLQEKDNITSCIKIENSLFETTVITGKIDQKSDQQIRLQGNPKTIQVTSKTIFNDIGAISTDPDQESMSVRIRALVHDDNITALTVTPILSGIHRTITGTLDQVLQYGFTLLNLKMSFCFEALPKPAITNLPANTIITVTGKDLGYYFLVASYQVIASPPSKPGSEYYLAKADTKAPSMARKVNDGLIDFVVGLDQKNLLLASGKTLPISVGTFPIGSKIKVLATDNQRTPVVSLVEMGDSSLFQGNVTLIKKFNNGAYLYSSVSESYTTKILIAPKKGTTLPEKGILQGILVRYENVSIVIDFRLFQMKSLTTTKGLVTRVMKDKQMFVLDNGTTILLDPWSQINGGTISCGNTLQLFGTMENGVFHAYVITIEKESVMFKGVIVEIDRKLQKIKLDSGEIIFWNNETNLSNLSTPFQKGDLIFIRAYKNETSWIATYIWTPTEGSPEPGDNA